MKLKSSPYLLLILLLIVLGSCSKKSNIPVPEDAAIVLHIDGASLSSKLSWEEFKQGELYKLADKEATSELQRKILSNPDSSGVDIKSDAYLFIKVHGRGGYTGFTMGIKDEKAFTAFATSVLNKKETTESSLSVIREHNVVYTWNSKRLVIIANSPEINTASYSQMGRDNDGGSRILPEDSLFKFASEVYSLKGESSIGSNKKFTSMMKEKGDMHVWLSSGDLMGGSIPGLLAITKASLLFEGNYTTAVLNFDDGRITLDGKSYFNKELADLYKKYSSKNLDEDMLKKIPSNNVTGVLAMNYPPEGLKAFLALLGLDGLINMYLAELGYSIDDFIKANKGDLMLAVTDFSMRQQHIQGDTEPDQHMNTKPDAKILFATSVNDKIAFEKLIGLLTEKMKAGPESFQEMGDRIPHQLKDNWFVAGSDSASVYGFGTKNYSPAFVSKLSGYPIGLFIDIQKILGGLNIEMDSTSKEIYTLSAAFWQDAILNAGNHKNDATESHFEINLVDKKTNSLKQLNNYLGSVAKLIKEQEDKRKAMWDTETGFPVSDSTMSVTPVK